MGVYKNKSFGICLLILILSLFLFFDVTGQVRSNNKPNESKDSTEQKEATPTPTPLLTPIPKPTPPFPRPILPPLPTSYPIPTPRPVPTPVPTAFSTPIPRPTPVMTPPPKPVPTSFPTPRPTPSPRPTPRPTPIPQPIPPRPTPIPNPQPIPTPVPTPVLTPSPFPFPIPTPTPHILSTPKPTPPPIPGQIPPPSPIPMNRLPGPILEYPPLFPPTESIPVEYLILNYYLNIKKGSKILIQSTGDSLEEPVYGYTGFDQLPDNQYKLGSKIVLKEMVLDIPSDLPLGHIYVELMTPASFIISNPTKIYRGDLILRITLPLYNKIYYVIGHGQLQGNLYPYQKFSLDMELETRLWNLLKAYRLSMDMELSRLPVERDWIPKRIEEFLQGKPEIGQVAIYELIKYGRPALYPLSLLYNSPLTEEKQFQLNWMMGQIMGVRLVRMEWVGHESGFYRFVYMIYAPMTGTGRDDKIYGIHFQVGTPNISNVDHRKTKGKIALPGGWRGQYDIQSGEYRFYSATNPLTPGIPFKITIETNKMRFLIPGELAWYWVDKQGRKIIDSHKIQGPVFSK